MNQTSFNESARAGRAPYRRSRQTRPSLIFAIAMLSCAAFAAVPNAGGEYTFSTSYGNDYRTTGQTGDQIWNVQNPITVGAFYPGQTDIVPYWQIYRGAAITGTRTRA